MCSSDLLGRNKEGDSAGFEENEGLAVTKWRIYYADDGKYIIYSQFNGMVLNFGRDGFYITELNQSDEEQGLYIK